MQTLYPVALSLMVSHNCGELESWSKAILRERKLCGKLACSSASKIIARGLAWSFATSDVERLLHGSISKLQCKLIDGIHWYFSEVMSDAKKSTTHGFMFFFLIIPHFENYHYHRMPCHWIILIIMFSIIINNGVLRFSQNVWMSGSKRGFIGINTLNDELRVAYLNTEDEEEAIHMAQLEWAPCSKVKSEYRWKSSNSKFFGLGSPSIPLSLLPGTGVWRHERGVAPHDCI